ncbi:MAG: type II secretion system F family protein [Candidatus Micrarchaeota archaeon]
MAEPLQSLEIFAPLPLHALYSGPRRLKIESDWRRAHTGLALEPFLNACALAAIVLAPLISAIAFLFTSDLILSVGVFFVLFSLLLLAGYSLPALLARKYADMAEADLPMALRAIALHLSIKLPFEKAIEHAAEANYASSPLWKEALASVQGGESVPRALAGLAEEVRSLTFSRAIHQLIVVYEEGVPPSSLIPLAEELTDQQLTNTRLSASRMAMFGLLFISISCLVPAFFLILAVAAGPMVGFDVDGLTLALVYVVAIPLLNFLLMGITLLTSPSLANSWRPRQLRAELDAKLQSMNLPVLTTGPLLVLSVLFALPVLSVGLLLSLGNLTFFLALLAASLPFVAFSLLEGQVMGEVAALESELPNLLLIGASSGRFSLEKMLEHSSKGPSGPLAAQSAAALRQLRAGENPVRVLSRWAERTPSIMLERALGLLTVGYKTGGHLSTALRATAQDLLSSFMLVRERASLLSIQSYTLIAASGILVPAILAVSLSFAAQIAPLQSQVGASILNPSASPVLADGSSLSATPAGSERIDTSTGSSASSSSGSSSLDSSSASGDGSSLGFSADSSSPASPSSDSSGLDLIRSAEGSIRIYLLLNAALSAFFLSISQGSRERFIYYAIMLVVLSQAVWLFMAPAL